VKCDQCGKDPEQDGVLTVILSRKDGTIEALPWRLCRECAKSQPEPEETER
jgi:hypothetical protein